MKRYAVIVLTGTTYSGVIRRFRTLRGAAAYCRGFNELFKGRMTASVVPAMRVKGGAR